MALRENELARRTPQGLELRPSPLRVKWELADLCASDGHGVRCQFTASVRAASDRTDRRMLEEVLLVDHHVVAAEDIVRHFQAALRSAAARVAQAHDAREWIESDVPKQELIEAMKSAAMSVAFACGLEMIAPFSADVQSPSFERQRVRAAQQTLMEKQAAGQVEQFHRAAELLKQYQALRKDSPELSAGQVLGQTNSADQGALMQALLMAGARQSGTSSLWGVAGPYLVKVDASEPIDGRRPPKPQLFPLPPTLGPLRSVAFEEIDGRRMLLVGAQHGFLLVREEDPADVRAFRDGGFDSPLGFNRVTYWPATGQYCATHSEAGLVCWDFDAPDEPAKAIRPPAMGILPMPIPDEPVTIYSTSMSLRSGGGNAGPRNVRLLNGRTLIFTAGGRIIAWDGSDARTLADATRAEAVALLPDESGAQAIHEDGTMTRIDSQGELTSSERRFGRVRAAAALPWLGTTRLLLAADDGPVQCLGNDDPLVTQYSSPYRGLRALAGSAGWVAAVSPDRQRMVLWNSWEGRQPASELFIGAVARHRLADLIFA